MPNNNYNQSFLESPDPVTGLQRRTGQNFLDHKQTVHERLTLEHDFDPNDPSPQNEHGNHRMGSAKPFVQDTFPTDRPTGQNKEGITIPAISLDENDTGRLLIKNHQLYYWRGDVALPANGEWVILDTTPIGMIQAWSGITAPPPSTWLKCDGTDTLLIADYPELAVLYGTQFGGDGITTFGVPNLAGVSLVGAGQQTDFNGTGRSKGSNASVGDFIEDAIQELIGTVSFQGTNLGRLPVTSTGIFNTRFGDVFGNAASSVIANRTMGVFEIDLAGAGVRSNTQETVVSALAIDYYVKAL